jgi:hypothetical protein
VSAHRVERSAWRCAVDGAHWPCQPAKQQLIEAYRDRAVLAALLGKLMARAADELGVADPTDLYRRFLAWTTDVGEPCRICGKANHTVVVGLPPRLVPCDRLRISMQPE